MHNLDTLDEDQPGQEDTKPRLPIDPATLQKAVMQARKAARGNGINPDTILLNGFDGEMLRFKAQVLFKIKTTLSEKLQAGKETHGTVCSSEEDMKLKVREATEKTTIDTAIIKALSDFLSHRKDMGVFRENLVIKLDRLNKRLIVHVPCSSCHATGKINCMQCQGAGQYNCPKCRAHRTIVCPMCRGTKMARQKDGSMGTCRRCNGHGESPCNTCKRTGKIRCKPCLGTGRVNCLKCGGSGVASQITHVAFEGRSRFIYDREKIPEDAAETIDRTGPAIATEQHADIILLQEKEQAAAQELYEKNVHADLKDDVVIPFEVALPWGILGIRIGKDELQGSLFGMHPILHGYIPFLEIPLAPGLNQLSQAADGSGSVKNSLFAAVRSRAIADALLFASTLSKRKAHEAMDKRWALGISPEVRATMLEHAEHAFANICRFPMIFGLVAGFAVAAGIYVFWFMGPLRSMPLQYGFPGILLFVLDFMVVALAGLSVTGTAQLFMQQATLKLFRKILPPKAKKVMPRTANTRLISYTGAVVLFVIVLAGLWAMGYPLPEWIRYLIGLVSGGQPATGLPAP